MDRIKALEKAYDIVIKARRSVLNNDGAWSFLDRVIRYLQTQSREAFSVEFFGSSN